MFFLLKKLKKICVLSIHYNAFSGGYIKSVPKAQGILLWTFGGHTLRSSIQQTAKQVPTRTKTWCLYLSLHLTRVNQLGLLTPFWLSDFKRISNVSASRNNMWFWFHIGWVISKRTLNVSASRNNMWFRLSQGLPTPYWLNILQENPKLCQWVGTMYLWVRPFMVVYIMIDSSLI